MEQEEVVVEQAKTNPEAFGRLYDAYYQPIFGFLYSRTGNADVAKDLCSETFFQAIKNIHRYKYKGRPFKSWLFAIAVAQVGNYYRSRRKYLSLAIDECPEIVADDKERPDMAFQAAEQEASVREQIRLLRRIMLQLNQKQQNILSLRFFSRHTIAEIAVVMCMKEGTVKSHIHRALNKLHGLMLKEQQPEPAPYEERTHVRTTFGTARV